MTAAVGPVVGDEMVVHVGSVAHGGHCVARHEGQVLFVRHALPGEKVRVRVTQVGRRGKFLRADAIEVLDQSPMRRPAPCPVAAACGGCDWQHATPEAARGLKATVVREALQRFAGVTLPEDFAVAELAAPADSPGRVGGDGLGWRTRGTLSVAGDGRVGFRAPRSHRVVLAGECQQLHPALDALDLYGQRWSGERLGFVAPAGGSPSVFDPEDPPAAGILESAAGRTWSVAADGFWQVHPGSAGALVAAAARLLAAQPGERLVDLYAGVGLLGLSVAASAGLAHVTLVEGDRTACEHAQRNAAALAATVIRSDVGRWVQRPAALADTDLVVLDPPRTGAGAEVVTAVAGARPRAVVYVACDPVALARDVATFSAQGYGLASLEAFDLFPTTHHVECVALLTRR